ncbi:MAG: adenosylcobinamide-phosphate synthase CbiB [Cyanobacteria bacterium J069]|nr:MAG: cobalamin biosynthesis protein [Cyanobacteria bacterium J069]
MGEAVGLIIIVNFWENLALPLAIAALLDFLIGDPWNWLHPVQVMGWGIGRYGQWVQTRLHLTTEPESVRQKVEVQRGAGVLLAIALVLGSGVVGWLIVYLSRTVHPFLGLAIESILLASCFAGRSLRDAAADVLRPLAAGDLATARSHLSRYVGRDTENLPASEILRAVLETVTENATDGVTAPLFWAIAGSFTPLGPVPLALGYKAASTLDSMLGYKAAPYTHLGWCSARLDDLLTWLPCRLTVLTLALLSGRPRHVLKLCRRDAPQDPSPNAGWSECAYAAALDVQVGGQNIYRGQVTHKPLLADPVCPITPERIQQALGLTRRVFLLWLALAIALHLANF